MSGCRCALLTLLATVAGHAQTAANLQVHRRFASKFLATPHDVTVYLPPGYGAAPNRRYPILYMQDGQHLFGAGDTWHLERAAQRLIAAQKIRPLLIVGIHSLREQRIAEYGSGLAGKPATYARMLVEELKPFIDAHYRTLTGPDDTAVGGSSLGALTALSIGLRYPGVFGKLAI